MHVLLVKQSAKQGFYILCEEPMATSIGDYVEIVKDVEVNPHQIFVVGHGRCFLPLDALHQNAWAADVPAVFGLELSR